jgi:hypothetical protein
MTKSELTSLYVKLQKKANDSVRICMHKGCKKQTIKSHLLQKNGVLSEIAECNQLFAISSDLFKEQLLNFKQIGINDAFTFPGFCDVHDNNLFKEIECSSVNFEGYRPALLLSYRARANERRKKEIAIDWCEKILDSFQISLYLDDVKIKNFQNTIKMQKLAIQDSLYYEPFFIKDIENVMEINFEFLHFELPKIPVCVSGVFTYETSDELYLLEYFNHYKFYEAPTNIYINVLPLKNKTLVILGCLKSRKEQCWNYIQSFHCKNYMESLQRISDLLLSQVENWLCSPSFYKNHLKKSEQKILALKKKMAKETNERAIKSDFNLFEDYVKNNIK